MHDDAMLTSPTCKIVPRPHSPQVPASWHIRPIADMLSIVSFWHPSSTRCRHSLSQDINLNLLSSLSSLHDEWAKTTFPTFQPWVGTCQGQGCARWMEYPVRSLIKLTEWIQLKIVTKEIHPKSRWPILPILSGETAVPLSKAVMRLRLF